MIFCDFKTDDFLLFQITNFPYLRTEIESRLVSHVHSNVSKSIHSILALIKMEESYLNTNHEDFNMTEQDDDKTIYEGVLCIENLVELENGELWTILIVRLIYLSFFVFQTPFNKFCSVNTGNSFWFILKSDTLSCHDYKNGNKMLFTMPLNNINVVDIKYESKPNKYIIALNKSNGHVFNNSERLELSSENVDIINAWKEALAKVLNKDKDVSRHFSIQSEF